MSIDKLTHDAITHYYEDKEKAFYTFIDMLGWTVIGDNLHTEHSIVYKAYQTPVAENDIRSAWKTFDAIFPKIESIIKKGDDNHEV